MRLAVFANDKRVKRKEKTRSPCTSVVPLVRLDFRLVKPELNAKVCFVAPCTLDTYLPLLMLCRGVCLGTLSSQDVRITYRLTSYVGCCSLVMGGLGLRASKF